MSKLNWYFMFFMCTYEMKQSYTKSRNQISLIVAVLISNSGNSILSLIDIKVKNYEVNLFLIYLMKMNTFTRI